MLSINVSRLAVTAVLTLLLCAVAFGQVSTGTILGTAQDASGALIPGVQITATNQGTNQARQVISNETGNYRIEPLQPGTYVVTAELSGFRREVRSGVMVNVDNRVRIDFSLKVGELTETVEVSAVAPLIQADDSQVGQVMVQRQVTELPLNGRNFSALAYLTPGAFAPRPGSHLSDRGGFVAAGLEEKANQLLVDGINNNGASTMEAATRVNIDTVAEFKIQTQNYAAQYGRYAGAQVDAITKSGTNEIHGTLFGFTRNDNLDARNFFDPWPLAKKPEFKRHQYGATIGGPIKKDKAFFFFGFQGQRQKYSRTTNPTVPLPQFWSGDLSRIAKVIRNPVTGVAFPNNQIPASMLDPTALKFRPYFFVEPTRDTLSRNATAFIDEPESFWQPSIKINYSLNEHHQLNGTWSMYDSYVMEWNIAGRPELPNYDMCCGVKNQHIALSEIWTISTTVVNEFRAGLARVHRLRSPFLNDKNYARDVFGIVGTAGDVDPAAFAVPLVTITGYSQVGLGSTQPRADGNWMIVDTLGIQKGNHAIKFGADLFRQYENIIFPTVQAGSFNFTGSYTGEAMADFLLGLPDTTQRGYPIGPLSQYPRRWSSNYFVQDDWKAGKNLTLNYGLRWEPTFSLDEKWGRLSSFDPTLSGGKGGIRIQDADKKYEGAIATFQKLYPGVEIKRESGPLYANSWKNFAPRFGFAWTPFGRTSTVVRSGYGIFYTIDDLCLCQYFKSPPFELNQRFVKNDRPTFADPWPANAVNGAITADGIDGKNFRNAYYQHWNLGIQHELPMGVIVDASYVGKKGNRIGDSTRDINQPVNGVKPFPLFGPVSWNESRGNSMYHALQSRVEKRTSTGLTLLVSYSWSKLIDDVPSNGSVRDAHNLRIERGLGQEDMRHRFSASYVYALPVGRGKHFMSGLSTVPDALLGGWEFSGIVRMNSGSPYTPTISIDNSGFGRRADRPDMIGNPKLDHPNPTTGWWNKAAFQLPAPGTVGNAAKGSLIGPGYRGTDISLMKRFHVAEAKDLQFRLEAFNALNQSNFTSVSTTFNASTFGTAGAALDSRQIQLGLKFIF